jgi:hypothetical protein
VSPSPQALSSSFKWPSLEISDSATAARHLPNILDPASLITGPLSFEREKKFVIPTFCCQG